MPSFAREMLTYFGWLALAAVVVTVVGLLVVPLFWSMASPTPP